MRTSGPAIARYVGKYISKGIEARRDLGWKGVRFLNISKQARAGTMQFSNVNAGMDLWRSKVAMVAKWLRTDEISSRLGKSWAWKYGSIIRNILPDKYVSQSASDADWGYRGGRRIRYGGQDVPLGVWQDRFGLIKPIFIREPWKQHSVSEEYPFSHPNEEIRIFLIYQTSDISKSHFIDLRNVAKTNDPCPTLTLKASV